MAEIGMKAIGIVQEEKEHFKELVTDIREHPNSALKSITDFLKGLWNTITLSGIIPIIVDKVKALLAGIMSSSTVQKVTGSVSSTRDEVLPLLSSTKESVLGSSPAPAAPAADAVVPAPAK